MGGRFGKYGDLKRLQILRQTRREKYRLESARLRARIHRNRRKARLAAPAGHHDRFRTVAKGQAGDKPLETG